MLLDKCRRDIRNAKYICSTNLRTEHDFWLNKSTTEEEKRIKAEELSKAKRKEEEFYKNKSCYFGIVIKDKRLCQNLNYDTASLEIIFLSG